MSRPHHSALKTAADELPHFLQSASDTQESDLCLRRVQEDQERFSQLGEHGDFNTSSSLARSNRETSPDCEEEEQRNEHELQGEMDNEDAHFTNPDPGGEGERVESEQVQCSWPLEQKRQRLVDLCMGQQVVWKQKLQALREREKALTEKLAEHVEWVSRSHGVILAPRRDM